MLFMVFAVFAVVAFGAAFFAFIRTTFHRLVAMGFVLRMFGMVAFFAGFHTFFGTIFFALAFAVVGLWVTKTKKHKNNYYCNRGKNKRHGKGYRFFFVG